MKPNEAVFLCDITAYKNKTELKIERVQKSATVENNN